MYINKYSNVINYRYKNILTEFTANDLTSLVGGKATRTLTTQTPHPPSKHIAFVPYRFATDLIYSLRVKSGVYLPSTENLLVH